MSLQNLVEVIVKASEYPINSLDFVDDEEREVVLDKFNATVKDLPSPYAGATIHGLFEHWVTQTPDAKAISFEVCICRLLWAEWSAAYPLYPPPPPLLILTFDCQQV